MVDLPLRLYSASGGKRPTAAAPSLILYCADCTFCSPVNRGWRILDVDRSNQPVWHGRWKHRRFVTTISSTSSTLPVVAFELARAQIGKTVVPSEHLTKYVTKHIDAVSKFELNVGTHQKNIRLSKQSGKKKQKKQKNQKNKHVLFANVDRIGTCINSGADDPVRVRLLQIRMPLKVIKPKCFFKLGRVPFSMMLHPLCEHCLGHSVITWRQGTPGTFSATSREPVGKLWPFHGGSGSSNGLFC